MTKERKCLFINQPLASEFACGRLTSHLMPRKTSYRGEVLICAADGTGCEPDYPDGCWLAVAELVDCRRVDAVDDRLTDAYLYTKTERRRGWLYRLKDVRRLVEFPCHGDAGLADRLVNEDDIVEYPTHVLLDEKGYNMIKAGTWKKRTDRK